MDADGRPDALALALADPTLAGARADAARGRWPAVVTSLSAGGATGATGASRVARQLLLAEALLRTGQAAAAATLLRAALPDAERDAQRGSHAAAYRTLLNLHGAAAFAVGALEEADAAWTEALEQGRAADDWLLVARAANNLGSLANLRGASQDALSFFQIALPLYQRLGDRRGLGESHHNIALTYRDLGNLARADEHEAIATTHARTAGNDRLAAIAAVGRAEIALRGADHRLAAAGALRVARSVPGADDPALRADALRVAGQAFTCLERWTEARGLVDEAVELATRTGQALVRAEATLASAELAWREGHTERARREGRESRDALAALGAPRERARADALLRLTEATPA